MKCLPLKLARATSGKAFRIHRFGLHESMEPYFVDRPEGTGDYLFMLFHDDVQVRGRTGISLRSSNSLVIWTPQDGHFYGTQAAPWSHSWFHAAGRDIPRILRAGRLPLGEPFVLGDTLLLENFLLESADELNGWRQPDELVLRNLFENFIRRLARHVFQKAERFAPDALLALRTFIDERFAEKLHLSDLARRVGWSVPHLCTEFKRFFGLPVVQYLLQVRMNHATYLLRDQNLRVGEIARQIGYPDLYTFSKMFKRRFGLSPRNFRKLATR
jgi:AraC-like DNA-binding protein